YSAMSVAHLTPCSSVKDLSSPKYISQDNSLNISISAPFAKRLSFSGQASLRAGKILLGLMFKLKPK
ncbi:hypothetical protein NAI42_11570, partial [Francisella tularensis subsp. holarctica]